MNTFTFDAVDIYPLIPKTRYVPLIELLKYYCNIVICNIWDDYSYHYPI